jgi:alpha-tubulin suppressor-like RCC1 family protein
MLCVHSLIVVFYSQYTVTQSGYVTMRNSHVFIICEQSTLWIQGPDYQHGNLAYSVTLQSLTVEKTAVTDGTCHLLAFYLNYILIKQAEGIQNFRGFLHILFAHERRAPVKT